MQTQSSSVNTIYRFVSKSLSIGPVVVTVSTGALQASSLSSILNRSTSITVNRVRNFHPERYGQRICNIYYIIYVSGGSQIYVSFQKPRNLDVCSHRRQQSRGYTQNRHSVGVQVKNRDDYLLPCLGMNGNGRIKQTEVVLLK